jgi:hypothetical protein
MLIGQSAHPAQEPLVALGPDGAIDRRDKMPARITLRAHNPVSERRVDIAGCIDIKSGLGLSDEILHPGNAATTRSPAASRPPTLPSPGQNPP